MLQDGPMRLDSSAEKARPELGNFVLAADLGGFLRQARVICESLCSL
jgi:hypothetical protein